MFAVGEIEYPKQGHLVVPSRTKSAQTAPQSSATELGLAFGVAAPIGHVAFNDFDDSLEHGKRMNEALLMQQGKILGRAVVFGVLPVGGSHQTANGQIEAG